MNKTLKKITGGVSAFALTAMVAGQAHAGALADAITGGLDEAELMLIGAAVLTLTGIVVLIRKSGKAAGG